MKLFTRICLFLGLSAGAVAFYAWFFPSEIKHYTADDLISLSCADVSEKHEEVIFAYHDAALADHRRTGVFPALPKDATLPFPVLMQKFIADHDVTAFDISAPFSISPGGQHLRFFSEISGLCAENPSMLAIDAIGQAADRLDLIKVSDNP